MRTVLYVWSTFLADRERERERQRNSYRPTDLYADMSNHGVDDYVS